MQKQAGIFTMFTSVMAAVGLFIRWLQNNNIYEETTGLPVKSAISTVFVIFCLIYVAVLLIFTLRLGDAWAEENFRAAFRGRNILFPVMSAALGIAMSVASAALLFSKPEGLTIALQSVLGLGGLVCGICFPLIAMGPKKDSSGTFACVYTFIPVIFFSIWLIIAFKEHAQDPILWHYAIEVLAIASATLGFYYGAGYAFDRPRLKQTVFFTNLGAFFCIAALGDTRVLPRQIIIAAPGIVLLLMSNVFISNMKDKKPRQVYDEQEVSEESAADEGM